MTSGIFGQGVHLIRFCTHSPGYNAASKTRLAAGSLPKATAVPAKPSQNHLSIHPRTLLAKMILTELVVVREWLHETAPPPQHESERGSEKSLAQALYSFVRAGRLDEAVELRRKAHQSWRAANICGPLLFQWRSQLSSRYHLRISDLLAANEQWDDDGIDDAEDAEGCKGNPRRKL
ncbi:hypothetical protein EV702DRAFT_1281962 [Suillus placidus]|uniref:Nuclear pore complex protein n=1 Tax=Suillus placidus TaxID=48579 RepID=A0A9P6ZL69_9AGAM|nr:hypothetical protein EV702DRAFT_1281962 [Suillus placidus]